MREAAGSELPAKAGAWNNTATASTTMNFLMVDGDISPLLTHSLGRPGQSASWQWRYCTVVRTLFKSSCSLGARGGARCRSAVGETVVAVWLGGDAVHRLVASASSSSAWRFCSTMLRSIV